MAYNKKIFLCDVGYRDPIIDYDTIEWFLLQKVKLYKNKASKTKFWLDILNQHERDLFNLGASKLLSFIKSQVTEAQEKKGDESRAKSKVKALIENNNAENDWLEHYKVKLELRTKYSACLN